MGAAPRRGIALSGTGILLLLAFSLLTGQNPLTLLQLVSGPSASVDSGQPGQPAQPGQMGAPSDDLGHFAAAVLGSTEDVWGRVFAEKNSSYEKPTLVLFSGSVESACGFSSAAVGPFYCPLDSKVYLDLSFFDELNRRFGAPGDFARAYVIAHEVGHHVQNLGGLSEKVRRAQESGSKEEANALSVRLELQADCLAGVWGREADKEGILDPGDVKEALNAAAQIGDDTLQKRAQGYVVPESFTHGTSDQRMRWFKRGFDQGKIDACDTFGASEI